ncbi:MAG: peptidoglycan editing factor PgeF [Pseudomonadota bacterium]
MITLPPLSDIPGLRHGFFGRKDGVSDGIYDSRNVGLGSEDDRSLVLENRRQCQVDLRDDAPPLVTVHQYHSADVIRVDQPWTLEDTPRADAMVTNRPGIMLGTLAADCAPILLADPDTRVIGAAHAGWPGALKGVAEATVDAMEALGARAQDIVAVVGPRIGAQSYETGPEFRERFVSHDPKCADLFQPAERPGHNYFDLGGYVARRLAARGVESVVLAPHDTLSEEADFFSYRRSCHRGEPDYGRQMSAILLDD